MRTGCLFAAMAACWSVGAGVSLPVELKETKGVEAWVNCAEPGAWRLEVARDIRNGVASLRLTSGPTAVMTDPVQWGRDESDEQVAESILSSIFSVGQYSVRTGRRC